MKKASNYIYYINAVFMVSLLIIFKPLWATLPEPEGDYINDFAHVINIVDYGNIEKKLQDIRAQTGIEMTLVTIDSIDEYIKIEGAGTTRVESFATVLFNHWGVGNAEAHNGVMILFAAQDRQVRIELGRLYGLGYDQKTQEVIALMLPYFKSGEYSRGLAEGVDATIRMVQGESINVPRPFYERYMKELIVGVLIILFVSAGVSFMRKGEEGWGWIFFSIAFMLILWLIKHRPRGRGGGFGGGRSGGGGTSGSW